jgi:hypothetical protein
MRTVRQLAAALAALVLSLFAVNPASAANVIIVAGTGSDLNAGGNCGLNFADACRTLQKGINQAAAGDVVELVTGGAFFSAIVDKEITIFSRAGAFMTGGESPCLTINAGANDVVTVDGVGCVAEPGGSHGILHNTGEKLRFINGSIRSAVAAACAILFQPTTNAELHVENSVISENGTQGGGGGICIVPRQSAKVISTITNVAVQNNRNGVRANAANANQSINVLVQKSIIAGNFIGLRSDGATSIMRVSGNAIYGNTTALSVAGGQMNSFLDNVLEANVTDGAFTIGELKQ